MVTSTGRKELFIIGLIAIVCMVLSVYLIYDHIKDEDASFCDVGSHISCSKVRRSVFSELFGVPIAVFGLLFNLFLALISLFGIQVSIKKSIYYVAFVFYMNVFGVAFIFYLIGAEIYLGALCPFCTVLHVFQMISMWFAYRLYNSRKNMPPLADVLWEMRGWIICFGIINVLPILFFNFSPTVFMEDEEPPITNAEFSQCITHSGWRFYGRSGCGWCAKQKALFGRTLEKIVFVDCAEASVDCQALNVDAYPTWIQFDDYGLEVNRWKGYVSIETWEILTECRNARSR